MKQVDTDTADYENLKNPTKKPVCILAVPLFIETTQYEKQFLKIFIELVNFLSFEVRIRIRLFCKKRDNSIYVFMLS